MTPDRHSLPPPSTIEVTDAARRIAHSRGQSAAQEAGRDTIDARLGLRVRQRSRERVSCSIDVADVHVRAIAQTQVRPQCPRESPHLCPGSRPPEP